MDNILLFSSERKRLQGVRATTKQTAAITALVVNANAVSATLSLQNMLL
jgi:hypothetical protein